MGMFAVIVLSVIAWTVFLLYVSVRTVKTGNIMAVFRLGKFHRVIGPGLGFIIPLLETTEQYPTATRQYELPDEPEKIDRVHDIAEPGKKLPFRVPHKGMEEAIFYVKKEYDVDTREGDPFDNTRPLSELKTVRFSQLPDAVQKALEADSLNAPITSEVAAVFEWHLKRGNRQSVLDFIQNVSAEGGLDRAEEIRKRAEDTVARILQEYLAHMTLGHAIYMSPLFSNLIKERLEILVGELEDPKTGRRSERPWGIHIGEAYLKPFHPGHTINKARSEAGAAVSNKFTTIRNSEAEAAKIRNLAAARKDELIAEGEGEAGRVAAMAEVLTDDSARFVATLQAAEEILPKANFIVMPTEFGIIGGIGKIIHGMTEPAGPKKGGSGT
jgi:regulator of protease activity HflC (stomatin/prohibitin superfamily)